MFLTGARLQLNFVAKSKGWISTSRAAFSSSGNQSDNCPCCGVLSFLCNNGPLRKPLGAADTAAQLRIHTGFGVKEMDPARIGMAPDRTGHFFTPIGQSRDMTTSSMRKTKKDAYTLSQEANVRNKRSFTNAGNATSKRISFVDTHRDTNKTMHVQEILDNNRRWVAEKKRNNPKYFEELSKPQKPKYLYIGCSDSRVPANEIMGLGPGSVFIHRNVGNLVPGNDLNALCVIEYAVQHLGVTDIIVAGHYDCGAVRAAASRQDLGLLENWLRQIRDVYRIHREYLDLITNEEDRHFSLVELNVIEQCLNLYKTGVVQRKRIASKDAWLRAQQTPIGKEEKGSESSASLPQSGKISSSSMRDEIVPRIHGMVFNPAEGLLNPLTVDFEKRVGSLDHIYGLYDTRR